MTVMVAARLTQGRFGAQEGTAMHLCLQLFA